MPIFIDAKQIPIDTMRGKVAVIGAGTSGLIAAKQLAALGVETAVYDQKTRLGYPAKASGIISINGLKSLGIRYEKAVTNTLYGANIHAGGKTMHIMAKKPQAHVLDRVILNEICRAEAEAAGAAVKTGVQIDSGKIEELRKENIIVGADGPLSLVAKHFTMGTIKNYTLTYKAEYAVGVGDDRAVDLYFDNALAPKFFAWTCPNSKNVLEVGIGIDSKHGNSRAAFDRFVKLKEVSDRLRKAKMLGGYASMIPMQTVRKVVDAKNEVLLVGDAAGQVKPTTGGGIVFGGNAARLAARVIDAHIRKGASLEEYEKLFKKGFGTELALHGMISRIYSGLDTKKLGFLIGISKTLGFEGFFSEYGDMDRPSVMLKRFFLRGMAK